MIRRILVGVAIAGLVAIGSASAASADAGDPPPAPTAPGSPLDGLLGGLGGGLGGGLFGNFIQGLGIQDVLNSGKLPDSSQPQSITPAAPVEIGSALNSSTGGADLLSQLGSGLTGGLGGMPGK